MDYNWKIERAKLFVYLKEKYQVDTIYYVVGFIQEYTLYYQYIESLGYTLLYKETVRLPNGEIKGNVDIDIAIQSILDLCRFGLSKAYLITNDGDYNTLIKTLIQEGVFGGLIVSDARTASRLIKKLGHTILDLQDIKEKIKKIPTE